MDQEGSADLYYRLNVIKISIPPLREDGRYQTPFQLFSIGNVRQNGPEYYQRRPLAMKYLENYDWPGNVRELQNVLERMLLVSKEVS